MIVKEDLVLDGHFIYQDTEGYRFTSDAVRLANFAKANSRDNVIDLGTGCGIIAILMAIKTKAKKIVGIDLNQNALELAQKSAEENGLADKIQFMQLDIKNAVARLGEGVFSVVVCNPPYYPINTGAMRESKEKQIARHEVEINLEQILDASAKLLRFGGKLFMVHKADRLQEIIALATVKQLILKQLIIINPIEGRQADTVLLQFTLGAKSGLKTYVLKDYFGS